MAGTAQTGGALARRDGQPLLARGRWPSYSLGLTTRDNDFYREWDRISRDRDTFTTWMDEHVRSAEVPA